MNVIRKLQLPRRTFLRGAGAAVAIPFLDAMTPALAKEPAPVRRLGIHYFPNGYIKAKWTPAKEGKDYEMTPSLKPLEPFRQKLLVLSGLADDPSDTTAGFHDRAICSFLTGVERSRDGSRVGTSVDQIAAAEIGGDTQFASLELGVEEPSAFGGISWKSPTNRLPIEINPRLLYERMFGDAESLDPETLKRLRMSQQTILDRVTDSSARLKRDLGGGDRAKLEEYLESIRDIERRMATAERNAAEGKNLIAIQRPSGVPTEYPVYVKLMLDLQVAALQADMTRVVSFMYGEEASNMTFPYIGISNSHHLLSHDGGQPAKIEAMEKINQHQVELFSYFLQRMDSIKEGDATLLDRSVLMYGSSLGNANRHIQRDLPILLAGGAAGGLKGGRHLQFNPDKTSLANLYLVMLDKIGMKVEKLGDSTGHLKGLDV